MDHLRISIQMLPSTRTVIRRQDTLMEEVLLLGLGDKELNYQGKNYRRNHRWDCNTRIERNVRLNYNYRYRRVFFNSVPLVYLHLITMNKPHNVQLLKYVSLVTLTLQNALVGLSMRYARTRSGDMFLSSTAVFMAEVVKLITCLFMVFFEEGDFSNVKIIKQPRDTLKVCVPSLVYVLQKNLLYASASNLDAATYQWGALVIFLFGVILVQLAQSGPKAVPSGIEQNHLLGFTAALTACFLSGFAGIYFNKF